LAAFRFSRRAEADLLGITAYTLRTWGKDQAICYIDDIERCCQMLADNPRLGRAFDLFVPVFVGWSKSFTATPLGASWVSRIPHEASRKTRDRTMTMGRRKKQHGPSGVELHARGFLSDSPPRHLNSFV
jgi:plasmid stabilization system protein ParE